MKALKISIPFIFVSAVLWAVYAFTKPKSPRPPAPGFAVVELFTSEGCSSCPPAEELMEKLQAETRNEPVYILEYHVDYWDRLGWKDVFSSAACSQRQKQYAQWLKLSSVYTPQAVVNGQKEFVGSESGTLHNAIKSALQHPADARLIINEVNISQKQISFTYQVKADAPNLVLVVAAVQKAATVNIKAGENNGRTLNHIQVVRQLQQIPLSNHTTGTVSLKLPADALNAPVEVIALLQNQGSGAILAAARAGTATATVAAAGQQASK